MWGNHVTLVAISEIFGATICIISSADNTNYITEIDPKKKKVVHEGGDGEGREREGREGRGKREGREREEEGRER
jgi:hypothetical protein